MQQQLFPDSIELAETLSSIGLMQYHMEAFQASFDSYQEALRIRRDIYGSDYNIEIASTLNSVGLVAFKLDIFELAKCCVMKSLKILKRLHGKDSRDVAVLWYNIATIYFESGDGEDIAIRYFKEALRIERKSLGPDHQDVVLTLLNLGQRLHKWGDLEEALNYFHQALEAERRRNDDNQLSVGKILNLIGNVHLQQGNIEAMMTCYVEASRIFAAIRQPGVTLVIAGYNFYGLSKVHPRAAPSA